ncbi:MAG TPA: hypothetical protein VMF11_02230 [Candidatus Baltobacteraceae bacterium]|nr:hypothetical protein [Candidatus Baltobacteraceae bacterium]
MKGQRRRIARTVLLLLCAATAGLIVVAFVDLVGLGTTPWFGQIGATFSFSGPHPYEQVVTSIDRGYAADRAGLRVGDLLDVRANSALERWQWFDGFLTPMTGHTTTLAVTRGTRHLRVRITPEPWDLRRYWYLWSGPVGMFFVTLMAALIAWRAEPTKSNLTLAAALVFFALGALCATNNFAVPYLWFYVALSVLGLLVPAAAALWVLYATTFGAPVSRARRVIAVLCYCVLAVIAGCNVLQALAFTTLWLDPTSRWLTPLVVPWAIALALALTCSALGIGAARGAERQRAAWSLASIAAFFVIFIVFYYAPNYAPTYGVYAFETAIFNINFFTLPLLLVYVTLSRRLIDVGFVLNRAAVFTLVSAIIIGSFIVLEWSIGTWLTRTTRLTSSAIGLAIAMGLGLSLRFIHRHVDRFVDRVFFRKRHEDEAALRRFAHECAYITDAATLEQRTIAVVDRHTASESVEIVYPQIDVDENDPALTSLKAWGKPLDLRGVPETAIRGEYALPMIARGVLVGALVCGRKTNGESFAPDELDALAALAYGVGIALDAIGVRSANSTDSLRKAIEEMRDAIVGELRTLAPPP